MTRTITTPEELDALPVGSIIADFGPGRSWNDSAVIACKAAAGDWTIMGGDPDRRWQSSAVFVTSLGHVVAVLHDPSVPAPDPDDREALAQALFDWNTPTDPYFVVHGRSGEVSDGDGYLPIADAILAAGFRRLTVTPEMIEAAAEAQWDRDGQYNMWSDESSDRLAQLRDGYRDDARAVLEAALGDTK